MKLPNVVGYLWLNRIVFYSAVVVGCVLAFSPANMGLQPKINDKALHLIGFVIMAFLSHMAHPQARRSRLIVGLIIFGLFIEAIQAYLPSRHFSLWDWAADILGVVIYFQLLALPLMHFLRNRFLSN